VILLNKSSALRRWSTMSYSESMKATMERCETAEVP
jgi:hypothetical protein